MNRDKPTVFKTPSGGGAMRFGRPAASAEGTTTGPATKKRDVSAAELERDPHSMLSKRPYIPLTQPSSGLTPRLASSSMSMQTPTPRSRLPPIPVPSSSTSAYLTPSSASSFSSSSLNPNKTTSNTNANTETTTPKPRPKPLPNSSLERQIVTLTTQNSALQTKLREKEGEVRGLERDLRWFEEKEQEREREGAERQKITHGADGKGEGEFATLRTAHTNVLSTLSALQDTHASLQSTSSSQASHISRLTAQVESLNAQLDSLTRHLAEVERERDESRREGDERMREIERLRDEVEDARAHARSQSNLNAPSSTPTRESSAADDARILTHQLQTQTTHIRTLELGSVKLSRENEMLRSQVGVLKRAREELEVVKEEKRGLEALVEGLRDRALNYEHTVSNPNAMDTGMDMDTTTVVSSFSHPSAATAPATAAALQELLTLRSTHAALLDKYGTTTALLTQRSSELAALQSQLTSLRSVLGESEDLKRLLGVEREARRREEEKRGLFEREVGFLSELVGSYEREREVDVGMQVDSAAGNDSGSGNGNALGDVQRLRTRLAEVEQLLMDYKEANRRLGDEVGRLGVGVVGDTGVDVDVGDEKRKKKWKSVEELVKDVESVREENEKLKAELTESTRSTETHLSTIDTLEQTLFELRGEIAGGRHVPPNTRILEMVDNPERRWFDGRKELVEGLRRENGALMRRLEELGARVVEWEGQIREQHADGEGEGLKKEDGVSGSEHRMTEDMVPRESWELVSKEKEELEEMVRQKEKRLLRLQQVFTQKSSEFRDAIASILGVKLAFYPNGSVRVTSVFDLSASFVFSPSKLDGTTQLQLIAQSEQGGPQDLPSMMNYWIETQQCIPGFLASVTLECWEGSKREA